MGRKSSEDTLDRQIPCPTWQNLTLDSHGKGNMHRDKGLAMEDVLCVLWLDGQPEVQSSGV